MNKWDDRFLQLAKQVGSWSKDPSTQAGAVIIDENKRIISVGFNGFPAGIADDERLDNRDEKYPIIIHAEMNAQLFAHRNLEGCTIYTYPFPPCSQCASVLIQVGINYVVCPVEYPERWKEDLESAGRLFEESGVAVNLVSNVGRNVVKTKSITEWARESHQIATDHGFNSDSFPQSIALIHSEVSEALEAHREDYFRVTQRDDGKPEGVGSELADIVIRVFDTAIQFSIDIEEEIAMKQEFNKTRPYKHGKSY